MNHRFISKGKNVQEAIQKGLHYVGALDESSIEYRVIDIETTDDKGNLITPAIVEVVQKKRIQQPVERKELLGFSTSEFPDKKQYSQRMKVSPITLDNDEKLMGMAWVRNGQVYCFKSFRRIPSISPCSDIKLYKNNSLVEDWTSVYEKDVLEIEYTDEVVDTRWDIKLDSFKSIAILEVEPGNITTFTLKDVEPKDELQLEVEKKISIVNHLTADQVLAQLERLGIVSGIDLVEIQRACETLTSRQFTIAVGEVATEGKDGWLQIQAKTLESGKLKYLATVHPPILGKHGLTITGEKIPFQPVDAYGGNLYFSGDVEIRGDIQRSLEITAQGNIQMSGDIHGSHIIGPHHMNLGNIYDSKVTVGKNLNEELFLQLEEMLSQIDQLSSSIQVVNLTKAFKTNDLTTTGLTPLMKILLESKFKPLTLLCKQFFDKVKEKKNELHREWIELSILFYRTFITFEHVIMHCEQFDTFAEKVKQLRREQQPSKLQFQYAKNSTIHCNGDIVVKGRGIQQTTIHSKGSVTIEGLVHGSHIVADKDVRISKVGSIDNNEKLTVISVPKDQKIRMEHVFGNTIIQLGDYIHEFTEEVRHICARIEKEQILFMDH